MDKITIYEQCRISIHALREEGDRRLVIDDVLIKIFLSTPSARRATDSPLDERCQLVISIHALREEGDSLKSVTIDIIFHFYPRPPRGGRPGCCTSSSSPTDFYPRPPRGGRREQASTLRRER